MLARCTAIHTANVHERDATSSPFSAHGQQPQGTASHTEEDHTGNDNTHSINLKSLHLQTVSWVRANSCRKRNCINSSNRICLQCEHELRTATGKLLASEETLHSKQANDKNSQLHMRSSDHRGRRIDAFIRPLQEARR